MKKKTTNKEESALRILFPLKQLYLRDSAREEYVNDVIMEL